MKHFKKKLLVILIILIACLTSIVYAEEEVNPISDDTAVTTSIIEEEEEVDTTATSDSVTVTESDLYLCEQSVTIDYPVAGNVFVIAEEVTINNVIDGNVFILANKVTIGSGTYIYSDVFVCANDVTVSGYLYDLYSVSSKLTITSNAYIIRDVKAAADSLTLNGIIKRNANLSFENVEVDESSSLIGGNLDYSSSSASIPESIVSGTTTFNEENFEESVAISVGDYVSDALKVLIIALIVILIVIFAMPKFADKEQSILEHKALASLGYGVLALIVIPIVCFILFCTVIGIIPAFALLFAYIFILMISSAIVSIPIGKIICKKIKKETKGMNVLMSIISVLIIWALEQIPFVGGIVALLVAILGLGILTYSIFHFKNKDKNIVAEASVIVEPKKDSRKNKDDGDKKSSEKDDTDSKKDEK